MGLGSLMIIAMSAWLNASALAGAAAIQQHLAVSVQAYTRDLDRAHSNVLAVQSLVPDIQMAATRFSRLGEAERAGSLTGTAGSGTVVQLLTQMSTQLDNLSKEVTGSADRAKTLYEQGGKHLAKMRELISVTRTDQRSQRCLRVRGHVADGRDRSVAADLGRAGGEARRRWPGRGLHRAGGRRARRSRRAADQRRRPGRKRGRRTIRGAVGGRVDKILDVPQVEPARFQPLSTAEAVLRYAGDFIPSWAGAISIDLMPAVLVLIFCVVHAAIRREGQPEANAATMTAADIITALHLAREVETASAAAKLPAGDRSGARTGGRLRPTRM